MIDQPMDSMSIAIRQNDQAAFRSGFAVLAATCNYCHKATNHEFKVIKIPDTPPFSNQNYKAEKRK